MSLGIHPNFFELPEGSSDPLRKLYEVQNSNEEAFFSSLKNEPLLLTELFELTCSNEQWKQNNEQLFKAIAAQILELEVNGGDSELLKKISGICEKSLFSPQKINVEEPLFPIYMHRLTPEKALNVLLSKRQDLSAPLAKQALDFLFKQTGQKIEYGENGILKVTVIYMDEQTAVLLKIISQFDSEKRKKIAVHLDQGKKNMSLADLKNVLIRHGREVDSLNLNNDINEQNFEELIVHCVKLNYLSIRNTKITNLEALSKLPQLTTLDCKQCHALKALPELPALTELDCTGCQSLEALPKFPQLTILICTYCEALQTLSELPLLRELRCSSCYKLKGLPELPALTELNCSHCKTLQTLPKFPQLTILKCENCQSLQKLPELPALKTLDCSNSYFLKALPKLPALTTLNCSRCHTIKALPQLPALTTLQCDFCSSFKLIARISFLLNIYYIDRNRCLNFYGPLKVSEKYINYFESKAKARQEVIGAQESGNMQSSIGELRKIAFSRFPFLFDLLYDDEFYEITLPIELQSEIDRGETWKALEEYYKIPPKHLQKIPISTNEVSTQVIINMMRKGILKPEWLPQLPEEIEPFWVQNPNKATQKLRKEQEAFCDVLKASFVLTIKLWFKCDINNHETYPNFLLELIKNTAKSLPKSWKDKASVLPEELRNQLGDHFNIKDALDDYIKTVFLPYKMRIDLAYQPGSGKELLDKVYSDMMERFLKGVPIGAICELSTYWHEPGRMAELNKAKTFSDQQWEPLFSPPVHYPSDGIYAIPLTTSAELQKEGKDLAHCVGGYTRSCLEECSHIISLRNENGESLSTLELVHSLRNGRDNDPEVINIKGQTEDHLRLKQHYGKRNQEPSPLCKKVQGRLFDEIRSGKVAVNLPALEKKREERVQIMKHQADMVLIGYDPADEEQYTSAKEIYRRHGFGDISYANTLRANFDALTGVKQEKQKSENLKARSDKAKKVYITAIQKHFDETFGEGRVEVALDHTQKKKRYGEVLITLTEGSQLTVDDVKAHLNSIHSEIQLSSGERHVKIDAMTPRNFVNMLRHD